MTQTGLHHVTAISGPARRNLDFYTGTLGMRLVKKTVNFDDPTTYHFYYGDAAGRPGTIVTFFPWAQAAPGRLGPGETQETALRIPQDALGFWMHRLVAAGVPHEAPETRFGETVLRLRDPDGMRLALVAVPDTDPAEGWTGGDVPAAAAIDGLHGVTLLLEEAAPTGAILTDVMGLAEIGHEGPVTRYRAPGEGPGRVVDIRAVGGFPRGQTGAGTVHHIAFRAADDAAEAEMARRVTEHHGIRTTEQKDRNYFRSVYFRSPGGVLFEIATDDPGFTADEAPDALGSALRLPAFLEPRRQSIEAALPEVA